MKRRVVHVSDADGHEFDWGSITGLHSGAFSDSAMIIRRGIPHNARCTSECDARMAVAYSSPAREMRGE